MSNKKKQKASKTRILKNNLFSLSLVWKINKSRLIHELFSAGLGYFEWVFYSGIFLKYLIDGIKQEKSFEALTLFVGGTACFFILSAIYNAYVNSVIRPTSSIIIYQKLYDTLYKKSRNVELRCFEDSEFYNRYTMAVDKADVKVTECISNIARIVASGVALVIIFIMMFEIDSVAFLFVIAPIIGNFVFGAKQNKEVYKRYTESTPYNRKIQYINRVMRLAEYAKEVRLSNVSNLLHHKYQDSVKEMCDIIDQTKHKINVLSWFKNIFAYTVIFEGVLIYGSYLTIVVKSMSFAELAVLTSVMVAASYIMIGFTNALLKAAENGLYIENLRGFLEYEEKIPEDADGIFPDKKIDTIEFKNVSFGYQKDQCTIKNMSFTIKVGDSVALVGHNGAGKSTLIKLLFRLYDPTDGEILVNGINIKEYNLQAYRTLFAAAFQDAKILAFSIKENVLMGESPADADELVTRALKLAGVYDKVESLKYGIETILTKEFEEEGAVLSGGEYQKIMVARAFAKDTPVKVFDEPSSALDPIAEYKLYQSMMKNGKDKIMIFISHRLSTAKDVDLVLMLEQGQVIEMGTHKQLMSKGSSYARMYEMQAKNYLAEEVLA